MPVKMSRVYTLIGCLAVMGAVQAKEGNREPPQEPPQDQPPDGQGIFQIPPQEFQGYEAQTQQLQPQQQQQQQRNHPQRWLRRVKTMDNGQAMLDIHVKSLMKMYQDLLYFHVHIARTEQVKLIQQKNEALQPDQLNYLTQLQLAGVSVILITLTLSVLIQKLLSPGQQSNQRTIQILQTKSIETESRDKAQRRNKQQQQQAQRARPQRSTCYDTKIPVSAVPWGQSVDILKTQGIQTRTAQLLSGIITLLQAAATESATTACKHRLLDTCAGGLRAAALC